MISHAKLAVLAAIGLAAVPATAATPSQNRLAATEFRDARQDTRIASGLATGQINAAEATRLNVQQARIDNSQARLAADGRFSRRDYARVSYRQSKASHGIARARHNNR